MLRARAPGCAAAPTRQVSGQSELARTTSRPPESESTESQSGRPTIGSSKSRTGGVNLACIRRVRARERHDDEDRHADDVRDDDPVST